MGWIDRIQVWIYDAAKAVITVLLLIAIALFFLRACVPAMSATTAAPTIAPPQFDLPAGGAALGQNELAGTAPGASQVEVALDGAVVGTAQVGPDGSWSLSLVIDRPGTYQIEVRARDASGQVAAQSAKTVTVEARE